MNLPRPQEPDPRKNTEAEKAFLSAMLLDNRHIPKVANMLPPMCLRRAEGIEPLFHDFANQEVFEAIMDLWERDTGADLVTVAEELDRRGRYKQVGGAAYLASIEEDMVSTVFIPEYVRIVFEKWQFRQIEALSKQLATAKPEERDDLESRIRQAKNAHQGEEFDGIGAQLAEWATELHQRSLHREPPGIKTGMAALDAATDGARPTEFWVFAGRPGHGKSVALLGFARAAARQGKPVLFFSLEMARSDVLARLVSVESGVPLSAIRRPYTLSEGQKAAIDEANLRIGNLPLTIVDRGLSADEVFTASMRSVEAGRANVIIVDYLQKLDPAPGRKWDMRQEVSYSSGRMKKLALDAKVPVVVAAQVRRDVEQRQGKKRRAGDALPRLSDLKESGAIEQDGDVIVVMTRPWAETPPQPEDYPGQTHFLLGKNRNGNTGKWEMKFCPQTVSFEEVKG